MAKRYVSVYSGSLKKEKSLLIKVKGDSSVTTELKFLSKVLYTQITRQYPVPAIVMRPLSLISTT